MKPKLNRKIVILLGNYCRVGYNPMIKCAFLIKTKLYINLISIKLIAIFYGDRILKNTYTFCS